MIELQDNSMLYDALQAFYVRRNLDLTLKLFAFIFMTRFHFNERQI